MKKMLLLICLLLLITNVSAVTLTGTLKVNTTLSSGQSEKFIMTFTPKDSEKTLQFSSVTSNCNFVTVDKQVIPLNVQQNITGYINVPQNTPDGLYVCDLEFNTPVKAGQMVNFNIGVPVKVNVINKVFIPKPTVGLTTQPTVSVTSAQVTAQPTPVATTTHNVTVIKQTPTYNAWTFITGGVALVVIVMVSTIYVIKKRKDEDEENEVVSL